VYARSTTIRGDADKIDAGITYVRDEVLPKITEADGCLGLSMLVDRDSGRCIVTSSWRDEMAMRESFAGFQKARERGGEIMGGEPQVEEWEIAVMHRAHDAPDGACCRVTWLQLEHGDFDKALDTYRTQILPRIEAYDGFCSASMLLDRTTGRLCGTVAFESREACDASRQMAETVRTEGARAVGSTVTDVAEFELAIAHLRLPELV
jgi:quinol monooxygenase YgiN